MPTLIEIAGNITPIIDTFKANALRESPNAVRAAYEPNADRYFASDAMSRVRDSLVKRLTQGHRTLGYLIGEYGHGKTAAGIYLWIECERQNLLAVPPFQFTSFDDLVDAVSAWVQHSVRDRRSDLLPAAEALAEHYRDRSVEQRAIDLARRNGIELNLARKIVNEEIAPNVSIGRAAHVSDFLEAAANLSREAGFSGLVVFADEMQIFLDAGNVRENIEDFRGLILALRPTTAPLGLMFMLHEKVAQVVQQNAGDAMQRLQDDGASLNLGQHLDSTFPRKLLEHLCKKAGMSRSDAADDTVLEALGQIAQRKDISNGPRTVAAAIRCIARNVGERHTHYRVWDLAQDYEERHIVFDGVDRSLSGAMVKLLGDDIVRQHDRYGEVIRFLSMFPDGVSEFHLNHYELRDALYELAVKRGLLGTEIYSPLAERWALKALQLDGGSEDRLTAFVRLFIENGWYRTQETQKLAIARMAFAKFILPEIFPRRGQGDLNRKFGGHLTLNDPFSKDPEEVLLNGSFEGTAARFPERRIAIVIGTDENKLIGYRPSTDDTHMTIAFHLLPLSEGNIQRVQTANRDPRIDFYLNLDVSVAELTAEHDFPPELQLLRDSIVPRLCTANVLLNLLYYIESQLPNITMPEADRQQIREYLLRSARRNIEQMLFPLDMQPVGLTVQGRGRQMLESIFGQKLVELYGDYKPLHTGREAQTDLERYGKLLREGSIKLAVKRGLEPVRLSTPDFLSKMGIGTASTFDAAVSRLKQLGLLTIEHEESELQQESGRRIRFCNFTLTEHPLERLIRGEIERIGISHTVRRGGRDRESKKLLRDDLLRMSLRKGYLATEFETGLDLACRRDWLDQDQKYVFLAVPDTDPDALKHEASEIDAQVRTLAAVAPAEAADLNDHLLLTVGRIDSASPEALNDISVELRLMQERIHTFVSGRSHAYDAEQTAMNVRVSDILRILPEQRLSSSITLPGAIGGKLEDSRRRLHKKSVTIHAEIERLQLPRIASAVNESPCLVSDLIQRAKGLKHVSQEIKSLRDRVEALIQMERNLETWKATSSIIRTLENDVLEKSPDLAEKLATLSDEIVAIFNDATASDCLSECLARHTEFAPRIEALRAEQAGRTQRLRDQFNIFYTEICRLYGDCQLPVPREPSFDPSDPIRGYSNLATDVVRILREAISSLIPSLSELAARCTFLSEFRNREVGTHLTAIEKMLKALEKTRNDASEDIVTAMQSGHGALPALSGIYASGLQKRNELAGIVGALEQSDPPNSDLEVQTLRVVQKRQRLAGRNGQDTQVSIADLYQDLKKQRNLSSEELFTAVHDLYIRGNVEIVVKARVGADQTEPSA